MKPRQLRYLRINDEPPRPREDVVKNHLPVKTENLTEWFEFTRRLAQPRPWAYELLTIDFNFKDDRSGPWFPSQGQDPETYNADFLADPMLSQLRWSEGLANIGPNSGLLIGAHMVSYANHRDMPCGVAFHTYHPAIVIRDMSSAMLVTQILVASGALTPADSLAKLIRAAIDMVESKGGRHRPAFVALGDAAQRFRQAFLQRAGAGEQSPESEINLWMEPASLWNLLDIFQSAQTEKDLDQQLDKFGIEFYNRDGTLDSLDLRSILLDRLIYKDTIWNVRKYLPLTDAKPAAGVQQEAGVLWQFVETLASRTPANIAPVLEYFSRFKQGEDIGSINVAVKRKVHRLIALIFAWLDQYAEQWFNVQTLSWDSFEDEYDENLPPMTVQISALLRILDSAKEKGWAVEPQPGQTEGRMFDPRIDFLPLSGKGDRTISTLVREQCAPESPLYRALRYDDPESANLGQRRQKALSRMLSIAARWGNVTENTDADGKPTESYRLNRLELPPQRPLQTLQTDLAQRLGFDVKPGDDPSTQLKRIIQGTPGYEHVGVLEFLSGLEERPLPDHFKWLGWEFMEKFWQPTDGLGLPYEAWPICLSEAGGTPSETISLVEWRRRQHRSYDAARQVQSVIMPSPQLFHESNCEIWCWARSAEAVGGDYHYIKQERPNRYRLYIGDVCGKGLAAALMVQEIHGSIRALEEQALPPEEICSRLDGKLYERFIEYSEHDAPTSHGISNRWATLVCAILDLDSHSLTYTNAGHPSPLIVHRDGSTQTLAPQSRPVGLLPGTGYVSDTVALSPGDRILFFTDGLSEILEDELVKCAAEHRHLKAKELSNVLLERARIADRQTDDITLLAVSID